MPEFVAAVVLREKNDRTIALPILWREAGSPGGVEFQNRLDGHVCRKLFSSSKDTVDGV